MPDDEAETPPACVLCLSVYNNERGLPAVLQNIITLRDSATFSALTVAIFYDHSQDRSLELLQEFKQTYDGPMGLVDLYVHSAVPPDYWKGARTERIAYARNMLLARIRQKYANTPYFAMMDSNDYACVKPIRCNVLQDMLARSAEWDAVSFDRTDGYYDDWALSYAPFVYSFFHFADWERAVATLRDDFRRRREQVPAGALMPVLSAFNGFAVYKTPLFVDATYSATIDPTLFPAGAIEAHRAALGGMAVLQEVRGDCEHRAFHLAAGRRGARIRICLDCVF